MPESIRLLLVEDSVDDAETIVHVLGEQGLRVNWTRVETEQAFLAEIAAAPDCILADCRLPSFSAVRALELLQERQLHIPVIVISGTIGDEKAADLIKLGAVDFLLKDRLGRLGAAITAALESRRALDERRLLVDALAEREERYRLLWETTTDAVLLVDSAGVIAYANSAVQRMFGLNPAEAVGRPLASMQPERLRQKPAPHGWSMAVDQSIAEPRVPESWALHADGREFPVEIAFSETVVRGRRLCAVFIRDITARKNAERQVLYLSRVHAVLSGINSLIVRVRDRDELCEEACRIAVQHGQFALAWIGFIEQDTGRIVPHAWSGDDAETMARLPASIRADRLEGQGVLGRAMRNRVPLFENDIRAVSWAGMRRAEAVRRGYGSLIALPLIVEGEVVGNFTLYAFEQGFFNDAELKLLSELAGDISFALQYLSKEAKLNHLAYFDALTGLPNRDLLHDRCKRALNHAREERRLVAVVALDIKRFRFINDSLGRHAGDALLQDLSQRLRLAWPDPEGIGRVGADHFCGILESIKDPASAANLLEQDLAAAMRPPFTVGDEVIRVSLRAGISVFPGDSDSAEALLANAEAALRQAKAIGANYLFYTPEMNASVAGVLVLENKLRGALERSEFVLHYQPKLDLRSGKPIGLEALIRWQDPQSGLIPPSEFMSLLEETGMIVEVGKWAIRQALQDAHEWKAAGLPAGPVAVNVSVIQMQQPHFVDEISAALAGVNAEHDCLHLEITESAIMENAESSILKLEALRAMGIEIAIDDFGTGYSSLSYLTKLPVSAVKVDRSFITNLASDPDCMALVSTIITLAHSLKLKVIAEGVETEDQKKFLGLLRCDELQGYLFSRPLPMAAAGEFLRAHC